MNLEPDLKEFIHCTREEFEVIRDYFCDRTENFSDYEVACRTYSPLAYRRNNSPYCLMHESFHGQLEPFFRNEN